MRFFLPLSLLIIALVCQRAPAAELALVGGTVFPHPAAEPMHDAVVLVRAGRIAAIGPRAEVNVPADAEVLDCSGKFITAGFTNRPHPYPHATIAQCRAGSGRRAQRPS